MTFKWIKNDIGPFIHGAFIIWKKYFCCFISGIISWIFTCGIPVAVPRLKYKSTSNIYFAIMLQKNNCHDTRLPLIFIILYAIEWHNWSKSL